MSVKCREKLVTALSFDAVIEQFSPEFRKVTGLHYFATRLALLFHPIRSKTETNIVTRLHTLSHVFSSCIYFDL